MLSLAVAIATGWFWLVFYAVGPLTSGSDLVVAALVLTAGCFGSALWGVILVERHLSRTTSPS